MTEPNRPYKLGIHSHDAECDQLADAMDAFTLRKIRQAEAKHGVTWLGNGGPVYDVWDGNLARALYRDADGHDYIDLEMFTETLGNQDPNKWSWISGALREVDARWIYHAVATHPRGIFECACVDVQFVAQAFHTQAEAFPSSLWARTWWSSPTIGDAGELGLVEHCSDLMSRIPADLS